MYKFMFMWVTETMSPRGLLTLKMWMLDLDVGFGLIV